MEYRRLILLSMVQQKPTWFLQKLPSTLFSDSQSIEIPEALRLHIPRGVILLPTASTVLSDLPLRLSGIHSRGVSVPRIPRGSGRATQGHYMSHVIAQLCHCTLRSCCTPGPRGCMRVQVSCLGVPTSALNLVTADERWGLSRAGRRNLQGASLISVVWSIQLHPPQSFLTPVFYLDPKAASKDTHGQPSK